MLNLFELFSIVLFFIAITECGAKQDNLGDNEINGRRSNKYFKFQPRKENKQDVAKFRTSLEQLPCGKNTEFPMDLKDMATTAEAENQQISDYDQQQQPMPIEPPSTPYNNYDAAHAKENPVYDVSDNSEEAIDLNVNIVITNMPIDDDEESEVEETQYPEKNPFNPETIRTTKKPRTQETKTTNMPRLPTSKRPKPNPPVMPPNEIKPPKSRPRPVTTYIGDETTNNNDSAEEIDINIAVIVTEMPEEDNRIDRNTIREGIQYDDWSEMERVTSLAAIVVTNTLVGLGSFFSSFALTNFFFY